MGSARRLAIVSFVAALVAGPASADVLIKVDKATQRISVAVDGVQTYEWPVSTARAGYVTPNGEYRPIRLDRTWFSRKYYNSPMPYSIFFHGGYAIHGSFERAEIGRPASHGCVRLDPKNAEVLFNLVKAQGPDNTRIMIAGPASSRPMEVHSKDTAHRADLALERPSHAFPMSERASERAGHAANIQRFSPARSDGPPPLVDPFSELISYVRNHGE